MKVEKKKVKRYLVILFLTGIFTAGCGSPENKIPQKKNDPVEITADDSSLVRRNGLYYYEGNLFTGIINVFYPDGTRKSTAGYMDGAKSGKEITWYYDGTLYTERYYKNGMKDSTNTGYWPNGNKKFEYEFTGGSYDGYFKEWYKNGKIAVWLNYKNGFEEGSQKGWRENGKLYINYVVKNGKAYGVVKSRLCYSVEDGEGRYTSSIISGDPADTVVRQ